MKDILFTEPKTQEIAPTVLGKTYSQGLCLYQKILVLILSSDTSPYRAEAGASLIKLLQGANTPQDQILISLGALACGQVKNQLAQEDAQKIKSLQANAADGHLTITLTLADGVSYTGALT